MLLIIIFWFTISDACFRFLIPVNTYFRNSDPDETRNVVQLIESRGFIGETHYVKTNDGYILALHRIVGNVTKSKPVLLQHGLLGSAADWLLNSPKNENFRNPTESMDNSLGFALAEFGFDVWLGNSRGNTYSTNHTKYDPKKDHKFWEFSFDEMVEHDLPVVINYVLNYTRKESVNYIGHSQGTLIMFALLSSQLRMANMINTFIALAPVTNIASIRSPIKYLTPFKHILYERGSFLPSNKLTKFMADKVCSKTALKYLCSNLVFLFYGYDSNQLNFTRLPVYLSHTPAGTSSWNVLHYAQMYESKKFCKFDFGSDENMIRYNQSTPPHYNISAINSTKIAIFYSLNDWLSDIKDVTAMRQQLKVPLIDDYLIPYLSWNHLDFIWAKETTLYINSRVIKILNNYS